MTVSQESKVLRMQTHVDARIIRRRTVQESRSFFVNGQFSTGDD